MYPAPFVQFTKFSDDLITNPFKTSPEEQARLAEQARNFPVTKLPYRGPRRHARVQFGKKSRAVTRDTEIAFSDFGRMHVQRRSDNAEQWVPEFANNENDLRLVLAQSAWDYRGQGKDWNRVPEEFVQNLGELKQVVDSFFNKHAGDVRGQAPRRRIERVDDKMVTSTLPCDEQYSNHKTHVITVSHAGGVMEREAAVAYQSWRLRQNSVQVAEAIGLTSMLVRKILAELCVTARRLGFDATSPRGEHSRGVIRRYRPNSRIAKLPPAYELMALIESGKTFEQLAEQFGVKRIDSVKHAFENARKLIIHDMRTNGKTWEEIQERFGKRAVEKLAMQLEPAIA